MSREFFQRHAPELLIAFFGLIFLVAAFGETGGEVGAFLTSALDVALFVILAMLVYLAGTRHPLFRWIAVLWLLVVVAGLAAIATGFGAIAILPPEMLEAEEIDPETVDLALAVEVA
ncbi:MAG: CPBP family intramembrane metalloprotease, partial [Methanomicrobiales archaeon]|nr:CPBP family intramembrane metalloprotease [Methanomicrobiales archaeon]